MSHLRSPRYKRRSRQRQLSCLALLVTVAATFTACDRPKDAQAVFEHARQTFTRGDLVRSQEEAERGCRRFQTSDPEWAWRFRILEAESIQWRGMHADVLALLGSQPSPPVNRGAAIQVLALEGASHARLHHFAQAAQTIGKAEQLCAESADAACGAVSRAHGVLSNERGQPAQEREFFKQRL